MSKSRSKIIFILEVEVTYFILKLEVKVEVKLFGKCYWKWK